ncbi:potassium channel family protein [Maridesulfovibrio hydrothermalis]|uniref:TrkA-N domain protein n=1 Tax=Maridesulfovibrio hydrothermalis AM13 = DSM 14728 TaxID=1121451 RepID=L0R6Q5_9BACT|nr:TrkA family potassium uptake protein [Maridesulfovibrio hydrothermalis]CCO22394.1 TrkA-N domain protein [Maridesulfovibrio hydrothermalis AM13 = DSM 14728]
MSDKIEVGVIGLGKFGLELALNLRKLGHNVVGVDTGEERVKAAKPFLAQVFQADGTDQQTLEQLSFQDFDYVVVSTGDSMEASILVVLNLQEMGVNKIWVKAISEAHKKVLKKMGVDFVVFPEHFAAKQLAHKLSTPGMIEYLSMGHDVLIKEREAGDWTGKTLIDLNLTNNYQVQVIAIRKNGSEELDFVPKANQPLGSNDVLILIGARENLIKLPDS